MKPDQRRAILDKTLQGSIAEGGRVESRGDFEAVSVTGRRRNKALHIALTVVTFGLWALLVRLPIARFEGERRRVLSVDVDGNVTSARL